ncbi:MAG: helix-turn-helix domain-containing protein [Chloroflexota bacterium]
MELPDLVSVPEAAQRAGVARNTMRLAAKYGAIKAKKLGRNWLVDASDIERWKREAYNPNMASRYPVPREDDERDP